MATTTSNSVSSTKLTLAQSPPKKQKSEKAAIVQKKDDVELALEKAVFGDLNGFGKGLEEVVEYQAYSQDEDDDIEPEFDVVDITRGDENKDTEVSFENLQDDELFIVDGVGEAYVSESKATDKTIASTVDDNESVAWIDSDDEQLTVSLTSTDRLKKLRATEIDDIISGKEYTWRLRSQFQRIYPAPDWAKVSRLKRRSESDNDDSSSASDVEVEDEEERLLATDPLKTLLQRSGSLTKRSKSKALQPSIIDISRLRDVNHDSPSPSAIQSLSFHSSLPLLLSAGYDRTLRIYNTDGKVNQLATSLHIRSSPIQTAQFHPDGRRVFAGGRRRHFYIWDLESGEVEKISRMYGHEQHQRSMERFKISPCGRFVGLIGSGGWINLLDANSGQWISGAKIEGGQIADFVWERDGSSITIANSAGEAWLWSTSERRFVSRWADYGGIGITALSSCDRWCALGSQSGIINVYDKTKVEDDQPKFNCSLDQLVTSISDMHFSHDGQILAFASRAKKDAFRLAHLPSGTIFKNWPTSGTPLGKVTSFAFSSGSDLLATGNEGGKIRLFKLNHYA
ncbi:WD40-repeat-containing domain protein [Dipodascopsis uninucleata]